MKLPELFLPSIYRFLFCLLLPATAVSQQSLNMPLLGHWDDDAIPSAWTGSYSECWGYASGGHEYAMIGSTQGLYFFEITDPQNPRLVNYFSTKDTVTLVVNKDFATKSHYLYAVSDQGDNSLQIFDLQYLPDSVVIAYDSNVLSKRCHTVFVENERLYMCSNTRPNNTFSAMDIFSIVDPLNPVLLGTLSHPGFSIVHETYVRNDTAYCSNGNNGLWIYDLRNAAAPSVISIIDNYPENSYNHSSWLTADGKTLAFTDESHGKGVKLFDVSDIEDPQLKSIFRSNLLQLEEPLSDDGSVAHNPFIVGNTLLIAYYHDGVQAYDISNPSLPVLKGYYDTFSQNSSYYSYNGCWGLYPFLPSGNIIASDITNGLFILDGKTVLNAPPVTSSVPYIQHGANPVNESLQIFYNVNDRQSMRIVLFDYCGRLIYKQNNSIEAGNGVITIPALNFAAGAYIARISTDQINSTFKFIVHHN
jgi:choice-of-anchor B domain-containing protein